MVGLAPVFGRHHHSSDGTLTKEAVEKFISSSTVATHLFYRNESVLPKRICVVLSICDDSFSFPVLLSARACLQHSLLLIMSSTSKAKASGHSVCAWMRISL